MVIRVGLIKKEMCGYLSLMEAPKLMAGGHWDVQTPNGKGYVNKYPGGAEREGTGSRPNIPNPPKSVDVGKTVTNVATAAVIAYGVWTVVKWGVAIFTAPATGGGSLIIAGATP